MERQYVAINLHLNRSVVGRENEPGEEVGVTRIDNDPWALAKAVREAGEAPEVAIEATYGWVRHRAPGDRVGCKDPPAACRSRPLKPAAGQVGSGKARRLLMIRGWGGGSVSPRRQRPEFGRWPGRRTATLL